MKIVTWNVNGFRSLMSRSLLEDFSALDADVYCLQETRLQQGQGGVDLPGYQHYWAYADRPGYSGTAVLTLPEPDGVYTGLGHEVFDAEGRVITVDYGRFYLVNAYAPNVAPDLSRLEMRAEWNAALLAFLTALDAEKPVILCGDLNVAHKEIDLKNPSSNRGNAGFSDEERGAFTALLDSGFTDSFRHLYPDLAGAYSWWSYMFNARANNAGWRIDYFVVSDRLAHTIQDATIHPDILGSDHCPVGLSLDL